MHVPNRMMALGLVCALAACSGAESSSPDAASSSVAPSGDRGAPVLIAATSATGEFKKEPACMIAFRTTNRGELPITMLTGAVKPVHVRDGRRLHTVTLPTIAIPNLQNGALEPGATGEPWRLNVQGARCDEVRVSLENIRCVATTERCGDVNVTQQGLAGIEAAKKP